MSLRFLLGRAGSGKTGSCLEAVTAELLRSPEGPPLILLVPEQATFQMDRALVTRPGVGGAVRAEVLSFRRLAWRVLAETGGGARRHIDEVGKAMALRVLLARRRGALRVFNSASMRAGFLGRLAHTLTELHTYSIRYPELQEGYDSLAALGRGETSLAGKLHDLALISQDLEDYLAGRWVDPDDYLTLLADRLTGRPAGLTGARIWLDGFAGFTRQELLVLRALIEATAEVTVALCLDPASLTSPRDGSSTFHPTLRTYDSLLAMASEAGVRTETFLLKGQRRFAAGGALAHLEREYPNLPPRPYRRRAVAAPSDPCPRPAVAAPSDPCPRPAEPEAPPASSEHLDGAGRERPSSGFDPYPDVVLVAAESRRAEIAAAAREMVRLAREGGYRWREMSLVARSLTPYADLIQATLADHGVPHFIDRRRPLTYHPLVEFARSAVEVAWSGWAVEPISRLLKSDLWPMGRDEVDLLENYVLAHGVRGTAWTDERPWSWRRAFALDETTPPDPAADEVLRRIDALRREVAGLLGPFVLALTSPRPPATPTLTVRAAASALWDLITAAGAPATLDLWRHQALSSGQAERAQEHEQVLDSLVNLLDQMVDNLSDQAVTLPEFSRILEAGLETMTLRLVPPGLDQVTVGAIDRSRQPDVRVCFLIGANEGVFPETSDDDAVFNDRERAELSEVGLELAPSSREKAFGEDYLAYIALTRPAERLWVSYALAGDDGQGMAPSTLVARLRAALPGLGERRVRLEPRADEVSAETPALGGVVQALATLRRTSPPSRTATGAFEWLEVYNWLVAEEGRRGRAAAALRSLGYSNRPASLPGALATALYGSPVRVSVSRLERFAKCPFGHFASAGLALQPRPRQQVRAPEIGSYYHALLSVFTRTLLAESSDLADLKTEAVAERLDRAVAQVAPRLQSEVLTSTARNRDLADRLRRTVLRTIELLGEHARRSAFRPAGAELRFTVDPGRAGTRLALRGAIDRLETAEAGAVTYVRVIDFKSGGRDYAIGRTYCGLDLQLPVYLWVASRGDTARTGALSVEAVTPTLPASDGSPPPGAGLPGRNVVPAGAFFFPVSDPFVLAAGPLAEAELIRERMKETRIKGLALAEATILELMDRGLATQGPPTPLLPFALNRDGTPRRSRALLSAEKMDLLLNFTLAKVLWLAGEVLDGRIDVSPVREPDGAIACAFCDYHPLCRFDPGAGDLYRRLPRESDEAVWEHMTREVRGPSGR